MDLMEVMLCNRTHTLLTRPACFPTRYPSCGIPFYLFVSLCAFVCRNLLLGLDPRPSFLRHSLSKKTFPFSFRSSGGSQPKCAFLLFVRFWFMHALQQRQRQQHHHHHHHNNNNIFFSRSRQTCDEQHNPNVLLLSYDFEDIFCISQVVIFIIILLLWPVFAVSKFKSLCCGVYDSYSLCLFSFLHAWARALLPRSNGLFVYKSTY